MRISYNADPNVSLNYFLHRENITVEYTVTFNSSIASPEMKHRNDRNIGKLIADDLLLRIGGFHFVANGRSSVR